MAGRKIEGITVEIGGDVTKLDRALRTVNKELSGTQKTLKSIDYALKLDPTNVDMLAQRQKYLGQAAEESAKKIKMITDALSSHTVDDDAVAKWEEQSAGFRADIAKTTKELSAATKELERLQGLGLDVDSAPMVEAQERVNGLTKELEDLEQQSDAAYKALNSPITTEHHEKLQRELVIETATHEKYTEAVSNSNIKLAQFGATAREVDEKASAVADATRGISLAAGGLLTAMLGTVPATEEFRSDLSKLETNAKMAGVGLESTEAALKNLNRVSDETDSSVEALSNLLASGVTESNLQKAVENLAGAAIKFPDTVKIESLADSLQETLATGQATGQFAEVLDRLGVGVESFNAQLAQVPGEANKLNFALDTLAAQGMSEFYSAWAESNQALVDNKDASLELQQSLADMATALAPIVADITEFTAMLLDWFNKLSPGAKSAILSILGVTAAISPVAGLISNVAGAISNVNKVAGIFTGGAGDKVYATFLKWSLIIGAVVLAVTALIAMINVLLGKSQDVSSAMNSISNVTSGAGQMGGSSRPYSRSGALASLDDYPHFASGGVFAPNNPMLGVLGDNRTETEVAAPESVLRDTFLDALSASGLSGRQNITVSVRFAGNLAQLGRVLNPVITAEGARLGPQLVGG